MRMHTLFKAGLTATLSLVASSLGMAQAPADLKVGDMAPAFTAPGSDGKTHALADHKGKQHVVLAWFPKAFTAG